MKKKRLYFFIACRDDVITTTLSCQKKNSKGPPVMNIVEKDFDLLQQRSKKKNNQKINNGQTFLTNIKNRTVIACWCQEIVVGRFLLIFTISQILLLNLTTAFFFLIKPIVGSNHREGIPFFYQGQDTKDSNDFLNLWIDKSY